MLTLKMSRRFLWLLREKIKKCYVVFTGLLLIVLLVLIIAVFISKHRQAKSIRLSKKYSNEKLHKNILDAKEHTIKPFSEKNSTHNPSLFKSHSPQSKRKSQNEGVLSKTLTSFKPESDSKINIKISIKNYIACFQNYSRKLFSLEQLTGIDNEFAEVEKATRRSCYKQLFSARSEICRWPTRSLVGPLLVDIERKNPTNPHDFKHVHQGGWYYPKDCIPKEKVAIIIPFRNRQRHLEILLQQLHPVLFRQRVAYRIFVIEQSDDYPFNRGKLMNVGYKEALKSSDFSCFVFHDVDLIPENDWNFYGCPSSPMHLSRAVDKFDYKLPYEEIFGGVEMISKFDFKLINGFPNSYWGWGAEDDNLYQRVKHKSLTLSRPSEEVGRYTMIRHDDSEEKAPNRHTKLNYAIEEMDFDGLTHLQYHIEDTELLPFYTNIKVDLNMEGDMIY